MQQNDVGGVLRAIADLQQDTDIPKNVKTKLGNIAAQLQAAAEVSLVVNKVLADLDEIGNDANMDPFVRTQLFNLSAMLERLA